MCVTKTVKSSKWKLASMNASVAGTSRHAHAAGTLAQPREGQGCPSAGQGMHVQMLPIKGHNKIDAQSRRRFKCCINGLAAGRKELKCRRLQLRFCEGRAEMPSATAWFAERQNQKIPHGSREAGGRSHQNQNPLGSGIIMLRH